MQSRQEKGRHSSFAAAPCEFCRAWRRECCRPFKVEREIGGVAGCLSLLSCLFLRGRDRKMQPVHLEREVIALH